MALWRAPNAHSTAWSSATCARAGTIARVAAICLRYRAPAHLKLPGRMHVAQKTTAEHRRALVDETRRQPDHFAGWPRRMRAGHHLRHEKERGPHGALVIPRRRQQGAALDRG